MKDNITDDVALTSCSLLSRLTIVVRLLPVLTLMLFLADGISFHLCAQPVASPANPIGRPDRARLINKAIASYIQKSSANGVNVSALAASLPDAQADFAFVRDHIRLEPYSGLLEGPEATLVTRGGNDLDRSILLATLLEKRGLQLVIAHGALAEDRVQELRASLRSSERLAPTIASLPANLDKFYQASQRRVFDAATQNVETITDAIRRAGLAIQQDAAPAYLAGLKNHYWVQAVIGGKTVDFDPSFPQARIGDAFSTALDSISVANAATALSQHVTVSVMADYVENGRLSSRVLLRRSYASPELWDKDIRLAVFPISAADSENNLRATIRVGPDVLDSDNFQIRARSTETGAPAMSLGLQGMFGQLGNGLGRPNVRPPDGNAVLARLSIRFETAGPNVSRESSERVLFDRLDRTGAEPTIRPEFTDAAVKLLAFQAWDGVMSVGPVAPLYLAMVVRRWLDDQAAFRRRLSDHGDTIVIPGPVLSPEVALMLDRGERIGQSLATHIGDVQGFVTRPHLAFLRHGYQVANFADLTEAPIYQEGIDLINAPYVFVGDDSRRLQLALHWGAADAFLESDWSLRRADWNVLPLFAFAAKQHLPLSATRGTMAESALQSRFPPVMRQLLADELSQGDIIVAPTALIDTIRGSHYAWWSIDPSNSFPTGKVDLGGGQGLVEYTEQFERLTSLPSQVANFVGNVDRCYFAGVSSALSGSAAGQDIHECLKDAACEMLAGVVGQMAKGAPMFLAVEDEEEQREIEKLIEELANFNLAQVSEQTGEAAAKSACAMVRED